MTREDKPGHYQDPRGEWRADRRTKADRRRRGADPTETDRRTLMRRKSDREFEREHQEMIRDALEEFAADHDQ